MFTHRNPEALGGGEFFGRVAFRIIHKGQKPRQERLFFGREMGPDGRFWMFLGVRKNRFFFRRFQYIMRCCYIYIYHLLFLVKIVSTE